MSDFGGYLRQGLVIALLTLLNAFFSASEIAVVTVRSGRLSARAERGDRRAQLVLELKGDPNRLLATIQIGITLAGFLASATAAVSMSKGLEHLLLQIPWPLLQHAAPGAAVVVVTLMISYLTLVFGELVPKRLAMGKAEQVALAVAGPISVVGRLGRPFVKLLTRSSDLVVKLLGASSTIAREQDFSEEELRLLVTETRSLRPDEKEMIEGVLEFRDTMAHELMVPRTDIVGLPSEASLTQAISLFRDTGLSRVPVFENTLDRIIGVITVKDVLTFCVPVEAGPDLPANVGELSRPAYHVPETKRVTELLPELRNHNVHMAILVDEYGGTAGLVTLEDLIEEIVGEIRDEFDPESDEHFRPVDESTALVDGIYSMEELNGRLPIHLPEAEEYETVSGYLLSQLGRIPETGDEVKHGDWTLTISEMDERRITKVKVRREPHV